MHFHTSALCMSCQATPTFSTPIPNILILSEMCRRCGWNDLVGVDIDIVCLVCRDLWRDDVRRETRRDITRHTRA